MEVQGNEVSRSLHPSPTPGKVRSSNRMRYEVEAQFLRQQNGDLEQIRSRLGLSKRKICQLLLVDPSAWTRWTQAGGNAPPHIYKSLDWYLSILEKDPEYRRLSLRFAEWLNHEKEYSGRLARLEGWIETSTPKNRVYWKSAAIFVAGALLAVILMRLLNNG